MESSYEELLNLLSRIVRELPKSSVEDLARRIAGISEEDEIKQFVSSASTPISKQLYGELERLWQSSPDVSPATLSFSVLAAQHTVEHDLDAESITPVWTGPTTESVSLRRTEQALIEVIDAAESELLIVSFVAYRAADVLSAMARAAQRDVKIRVILETVKESGQRIEFDGVNTFRENLSGVTLFVWPMENRLIDSNGKFGMLHAKCSVADHDIALVTSANLTGNALDLNMELGVLIRGGRVPSMIADHFEELIRRSILKPIEH